MNPFTFIQNTFGTPSIHATLLSFEIKVQQSAQYRQTWYLKNK